ncbi:MAG: PQQ-binding-like beta-propeller repeat protein [Planctomycetes bacterium]|nr:PQQ-binding-like beta-propeller repeat protein [Planctomycetota bacterium]
MSESTEPYRPRHAFTAWLLIVLSSTAADATAQIRERNARVPDGMRGLTILPDDADESDVDSGPKVHMPVSLNIDRHLIKAQGFLDRHKYSSAFKVLHDVIEGRTMTEEGTSPEPAADAAEDAWSRTSSRQAVFSDDDRLFHPVRRLCHELLASLPPEGIAAYRAEFEFAAEAVLTEARRTADLRGFESVFERFFVTVSAAHAMEFAGDAHMDRGQFRAALRTFRLLMDVYPEAGRQEAGIDDDYVRFKIALCYARLQDREQTDRELAALPAGTTIRVEGELVAASSLGQLEALEVADLTAPIDDSFGTDARRFSIAHEIVPLWEFRFTHPTPYRVVRETPQRHAIRINGGTGASTVSLTPSAFVPGTSTAFLGGHVVFLDHFRVRDHEALSGRMLCETDGPLEEVPRPNQPRARVPVYDFATTPPVSDGVRLFVVLSTVRVPQAGPLLGNHLEALDATDLRTLWSTAGRSEFAETTILAKPTVFGDKLLVPVLDRGTVALQCIDARTGESVYRVAIHRGGTALTRPIAASVVVDQGLAFVLANAGAVAAVDAHTGSVRWARRYERVHPLRPESLRERKSGRGDVWGGTSYTELMRLPGFAPSEIVCVEGLLILAPADGGVLLCLDGATGEPVWMINRIQLIPGQSNRSRWKYIIGHDDGKLLIGGEQDVTCIELRSGVRLWRLDLPSIPGIAQWRGRGVVHDGTIIVPGLREVLWRRVDAPPEERWRRVPMPELSIGREPLAGPFNLQVDGMFLTACHEGGLEVYSSVDALLGMAESVDRPERRALLQAQAGDLTKAFETLHAASKADLDPARHDDVVRRMLSIAGELSIAFAASGAREDALAILDRCREELTDDRAVMRWHLARIEVFQALADLEGVESEQAKLYALMEGR